jgi:RNA 2',3'-cyclic 3'-phosphodiesterase
MTLRSHHEAASEATLRLFFALWPTSALQGELAAEASSALASMREGRRVASASLHITLAFLGPVPQSAVASARECAQAVCEALDLPPPGLEVMLDALECWSRSRVLCATASRDSPAAVELARRLKAALCRVGFSPDLKPFRAHVTLARQLRGCSIPRADAPHLRISPVVWTFGEFALVESRPGPEGSAYSVLESWPLCRA